MRTLARICLLLAVGLAGGGCGGGRDESTGPTTSPSGLMRSDRPLNAKHVYVGVSCGTGNDVRCDGIRLSVEVPSEPSFVYATIGGHRTRLTRVANTEHVPAYYQGGILSPGLLHEGPLAVKANADGRWIGRKPVFFPMTLRAVYRDEGAYREESLEHVRLNPGFG